MRDSDFTGEDHRSRFKICDECDSGHSDKYHKCIHTAECTYEYLEEQGDLLPSAEFGEINSGVYLLWKIAPKRSITQKEE
jgi:hypothetical protein